MKMKGVGQYDLVVRFYFDRYSFLWNNQFLVFEGMIIVFPGETNRIAG